MTTLTATQKIFINSIKPTQSNSKASPSTLIDRANQLMFLAGCFWMAMIVPQTPPVLRVTLGVASVVLMRKSGKFLDEAKDNPQRRIFEAEMKGRNM